MNYLLPVLLSSLHLMTDSVSKSFDPLSHSFIMICLPRLSKALFSTVKKTTTPSLLESVVLLS